MRQALIGTINGTFIGFNSDMLFGLTDGTYWLQAEYKFWYHYAYRPEVEIVEEGGGIFIRLIGDDESVLVRQIFDVTEAQIDDTFEGWQGNSEYTLTNGQRWKQDQYKYEYHYAYRPSATIYNAGAGNVMNVNGHVARVRRTH